MNVRTGGKRALTCPSQYNHRGTVITLDLIQYAEQHVVDLVAQGIEFFPAGSASPAQLCSEWSSKTGSVMSSPPNLHAESQMQT